MIRNLSLQVDLPPQATAFHELGTTTISTSNLSGEAFYTPGTSLASQDT